MESTVPSNWQNLTIEKYDDTTNPDEHLDVYITQTEECNALKDKIEELIKLIHLQKFVYKPQSYRLEGRNGR
ncbi:hypothetical protein JHK82_035656 [Glycine max]|nr:hypothetical protein JHK86_035789 [Glycine max]KAG5112387.1 hypothetical protein JHK82_035656 [Glycine max]KAG5129666.1 hypothetical protein JHK84_036063 [Glycine max]